MLLRFFLPIERNKEWLPPCGGYGKKGFVRVKDNRKGGHPRHGGKIISMYAKGMTTADIESHMRELYDIEISDSTISRITDKILPIVKEWQERPLEDIYAVVFMDAIHYHVRHEGRIVKRAVYIAIGIDMNGRKDVLGMYVGQNESAKFWLSILNGLKNRGYRTSSLLVSMALADSHRPLKRYFRKRKFSSVSFIKSGIPRGLCLTRKSSL